MLSGKNLMRLMLTACIGLGSHAAFAQSGSSPSSTGSESGEANFGIYEWDASAEAWVLLYSGYDDFYASEVLGTGDYLVDPLPVTSGGPGGGGGVDDEITQSLRAAAPGAMAQEAKEEPKDLERVVVTGVRPSMLGGSLLSVFFRGGGWLEGLFGQRPTSTKTVPAPKKEDVEKVTCEFPLGQKQGNAVKVASLYGMKSMGQRGAKLRIRWGSGTEETYINRGTGGTVWMDPVPGTCRDVR